LFGNTTSKSKTISDFERGDSNDVLNLSDEIVTRFGDSLQIRESGTQELPAREDEDHVVRTAM
jgi:hypothetical protein